MVISVHIADEGLNVHCRADCFQDVFRQKHADRLQHEVRAKRDVRLDNGNHDTNLLLSQSKKKYHNIT